MDYAAEYGNGFSYQDFLAEYATDEQTRRWTDFHNSVDLTEGQQTSNSGHWHFYMLKCAAV